MKVAGIEEVSKSRSRVYMEDGSGFVLYRSEMRRYGVILGEELPEENHREILCRLLPERAKLRAMNLLKNREYTVKQLRDKLLEGGYPEAVVQEALDYVAFFHYTDDLRYAVAFIAGHENTRSRRRIEQDLIGRGIDRETLERAWLEWEEQGGRQDEQTMIRKLLEKRGYDSHNADIREKQRQGAFLMRRGFSAEQIRKILFEE